MSVPGFLPTVSGTGDFAIARTTACPASRSWSHPPGTGRVIPRRPCLSSSALTGAASGRSRPLGSGETCPTRGDFAVICPGGMGRRLPLHSWGWGGQISDLARMPVDFCVTLVHGCASTRGRIYAVGGSMGGHETLLLLGQHPRLLAGAVAFDSVTDFTLRYHQFARSPRGAMLQALARIEVGGTPRTNRRGISSFAARSTGLGESHESGVPLQMWWSNAGRDRDRPAHAVGKVLRRGSSTAAARSPREKGPARGATPPRHSRASSYQGRWAWLELARRLTLHAVRDSDHRVRPAPHCCRRRPTPAPPGR